MRRWIDRLLDMLAPERVVIRQHERYRHALRRICQMTRPTETGPGLPFTIWQIAHDALTDDGDNLGG